jgi:hypothetical protein
MLQQTSDTQPVTLPNPPQVVCTGMWLACVEGFGCTRCCAMSAALAPRSCNQGCGRCAHQLSVEMEADRAMVRLLKVTTSIHGVQSRREHPLFLVSLIETAFNFGVVIVSTTAAFLWCCMRGMGVECDATPIHLNTQ